MKLSNVVVLCLGALLALLMVCFTAIACTMVVNWSVPEEAAILEGKVCSVQAFNSDYEPQPLADSSAPDFADMDANADFDLVVNGSPDSSVVNGVWFFPSVLPDSVSSDSFEFGFRVYGSTVSYIGFYIDPVGFSYMETEVSFWSVYYYLSGGWEAVSYRLIYIDAVQSDSDSILGVLSFYGAVKVSDSLGYIPVVAVDEPEEPEKGSMISQVTGVFDGLGVWLVAGLNNVIALFWIADTGTLTLLGVLAVCGLAVSVFLLVMGIIQNFLHFRG